MKTEKFKPSLLSLSKKDQTISALLRLKAETECLLAGLEKNDVALSAQSQATILTTLMHLNVLNQAVKKKEAQAKKQQSKEKKQ